MRLPQIPQNLETLNKFRARLGELNIPYNQVFVEVFQELAPLAGDGGMSLQNALLADRLGIDQQGRLASCPCNQEHMLSTSFQTWLTAMKQDPQHMHRKLWEWAYIAQALSERGMLNPGKTGLGFAVGQEPLASLFCSLGCHILATDVNVSQATGAGWVATGQHADSLESLNKWALASPAQLSERVRFRQVDMRQIPSDLGSYDFLWSACAFEHLGNLKTGMEFVLQSYDLLKPGGVAVHTTEYNLDSNWTTIGTGNDVIYRRSDLEQLAHRIRSKGGLVTTDFRQGSLPADLHLDSPPYKQDIHLRLEIGGYRCTSFGLILEKPF